MNLYATAKQIVVLLQPAHKSFQFRFPEYSERYTGKSKFGHTYHIKSDDKEDGEHSTKHGQLLAENL